MEWKTQYPRRIRPSYEQLLAFMPADVRALFLTFDRTVGEAYRVYNNYQRYAPAAGWVYGYCRSYRCELLAVTVGADCFYVSGVRVDSEAALAEALLYAKQAYNDGYEARYASLTAAKRAGQLERTKVRQEREAAELRRLTETIDPALFNRFNWSKKVSRSKLLRLYQSDARGLLDEELLDDVGYAFYARCQQARDTRAHLEQGRILCHHCGEVLTASGHAALIACPCGYGYTYREYRRSANAHNLPGGRATPIFHAFADKWPLCKGAAEKMRLIDWLIHECHVSVMSGRAGRSVCVNLIEGTAAQLRDMLEALAGH